MSKSDALRESFESVLRTLLRETNASRTTLRLDDQAHGFHIDDVVAEALAEGEESMKGAGGINHRAAATAQWVELHRKTLVQNDFDSGPEAPEKLRTHYRVKAQMLAPVIREGRLDGWVSVHEAKAQRKWSEADQAAIARAARSVEAGLVKS